MTLNGCHPDTLQCVKGVESKRIRLEVEEARAGTERVLRAYGLPLTNVLAFKYLVLILTATDEDQPEVVSNPQKAWEKWVWMLRILRWEVENTQTPRTFFKAVVQSVLLFGSEMWVVNPPHQKCTRRFPTQGISLADWEEKLTDE